MIVDPPHPLVAAERVAFESLHLQASSKPIPMIIDEPEQSFYGILDEFLELCLSIYRLPSLS